LLESAVLRKLAHDGVEDDLPAVRDPRVCVETDDLAADCLDCARSRRIKNAFARGSVAK
jgi:hypothetical protein